MIRKFILIFFGFSLYLSASVINIAVAANVSYAIGNLKSKFNETHPDIKVQVTLGSSGKLTAQITNGAPYDLFMSANMLYPNFLYKEGDAKAKPVVYAKGSLAILSPKKRNFNQGIYIVKMPDIKKIAIANPKTAPYGKAAQEALKNAKLYSLIKKKLVFAESVSQTVAYTISAVDLGFVAKSSLFSSKMSRFKKGINWIDVNPKLYSPIDQGIIILKKGAKNDAVKSFYEFILSDNAKKIFKTYGYIVP